MYSGVVEQGPYNNCRNEVEPGALLSQLVHYNKQYNQNECYSQKNQVNAISGSLENLKKYTENFEKIISLVDTEFAKYNYTPSKSKMKEFVGVAQARYEFVCQGKNISVGYGKAYAVLNGQLKKLVEGLNGGTLTKAELDKMKKAVRQE